MSLESTSGGPSKEALAKEEQLRALLMAQVAKKKEEAEKMARRMDRFGGEMEQLNKEKAEKERTHEGYFTDYKAARGTVVVSGSWQIHYNRNTTENERFKKNVDRSGFSLQDFITDVVQHAGSDCLAFGPGNPGFPGQKSTFRLELETHTGEHAYKGMTLAGGVSATEVTVFHAGPGS